MKFYLKVPFLIFTLIFGYMSSLSFSVELLVPESAISSARIKVITLVKMILRDLENGKLSDDTLSFLQSENVHDYISVEIERYETAQVREIVIKIPEDDTTVYISVPEGKVSVTGPSAGKIRPFIPGSLVVATSNPIFLAGSSSSEELFDKLTDGEDQWEAVRFYKGYIESNAKILSTIINENKIDVLVRVPIEAIYDENIVGAVIAFFKVLELSEHVYVELFYSDGSSITDEIYYRYGLKKRIPHLFTASKDNTITILPVKLGEDINPSLIQEKLALSGDIDIDKTTLSPIRLSDENAIFNASGFIASTVFGMGLISITRLPNGDQVESNKVVKEIKDRYVQYLRSQGVDAYSSITERDILLLATGNINQIVNPLKKLATLLPIGPTSVNQIVEVFEFTRVLITNL